MKNKTVLPLFLSFILSLIMASCTRISNTDRPENNSTINLALIEEAEKLPNSLCILAYKTLNSREKVVFWDRHIDNYLHKNSVTPELREHILKIRAFLNRKEIYDGLGTEKINKLVRQYTFEMYDQPVLVGKFARASLDNAIMMKGIGKNDVSLVSLNGQMYSATQENCTCYYSISCGLGQTCNTTDSGCKETFSGCGVLGSANCTGTCD